MYEGDEIMQAIGTIFRNGSGLVVISPLGVKLPKELILQAAKKAPKYSMQEFKSKESTARGFYNDNPTLKVKRRFKKPKMRHYRLYALRLKNDKYYVGMTAQSVNARYEQHYSGKGSKWTSIHQPINVVESIELGLTSEGNSARKENELTVKYMEKYGVQNVRGGSMCFLDESRCRLALNRYSRVKIRQSGLEENIVYQESLAHELSWI